MFDDLNKNNQGDDSANKTADAAVPDNIPVADKQAEQAAPVKTETDKETPKNEAKESSKLDDIFSDTDTGAAPTPPEKPDIFKPKDEVSSPAPVATMPKSSRGKFFPIMILAGFMVLAGGGYLAYYFLVAGAKNDRQMEQENIIPEEISTQEEASNEVNNTPAIETEPEPINTEPKPVSTLDSDNDGLTDDEERSLGTNQNSPDSDSDGLFDREEVKVYKTNPLNPDTDGDGFLDGTEVEKGYNPKGGGKLYSID